MIEDDKGNIGIITNERIKENRLDPKYWIRKRRKNEENLTTNIIIDLYM